MSPKATLHPHSGADFAGQLLKTPSGLLRVIDPSYLPEWQQAHPLISKWVSEKKVWPYQPTNGSNDPMILAITPLEHLTYPWEWTAVQINRAGAFLLQLQQEALEEGLSLRDAKASNIAFVNQRPILLDHLSLGLNRSSYWPAYRQFCENFLFPLAALKHCPQLTQKLRTIQWGEIQLAQLPTLLGLKLYGPGLFLHGGLQWLTSKVPTRQVTDSQGPPQTRILSSLESALGCFAIQKSHWSNYQPAILHSPEYAKEKLGIVTAWLAADKWPRIWDIGSNVGDISRAAQDHCSSYVAIDSDPAVLDKHQLRPSSDHLVMSDIFLPLTVQGSIPLSQRLPVSLVLMLGIYHHLRLTSGYSDQYLAQKAKNFGADLFIEFVGPKDPYCQRLGVERIPTLAYSLERFIQVWGEYFKIHSVHHFKSADRQLLHLQPRSS